MSVSDEYRRWPGMGAYLEMKAERDALQVKLDEIHGSCQEHGCQWPKGLGQMIVERDALQAEVERYSDQADQLATELADERSRVEQLEQALREAEWMVHGHVTGPETYAIWQRYKAALHPGQQGGDHQS